MTFSQKDDRRLHVSLRSTERLKILLILLQRVALINKAVSKLWYNAREYLYEAQ